MSGFAPMDIANIPDREERIQARRRRAEAKLRREKEEAEGKKKEDETDQGRDRGIGKQEVSEATAALERLHDDTTAELTDIRVRFDNEENERRIIEENARLDRYEALQIEAVSSGRKNAAVEMKWADLLYIDIPQDLHDQLLLQKEACMNILESKDRRIREFLTELKNKDEEYQKMLKRQSHDISLFIEKMRSQYVVMQARYEEQLKSIEQAYAVERTETMKDNKEEIEALFEKRMQMEESEFLEQRMEREKRFQKKIEDLRTQDADDYNKSKIALEKSIQELEQHLEKMMATYQLNKEKLDYNLQVLIERNKEHSAIQSSYKNRLNRLRESLNNLMARYGKLDGKFKQENQDLTEEYRRLTRQFKDLQEKYQHFAEADERKFREVWAMNESEARGLIAQILECDRIIHEQQLGLPWESPGEDTGANDANVKTDASSGMPGENQAISESGTGTGKQTGKMNGRYTPGKVKKVLDLVRDEGAYLLDMKARDEIAAAPDQAQRDVIQVNAILRYVGVESQEDVDLLVSLFYQGQDEDDETLYVDADDVLRILKDFIAAKEQLRLQDVNPDASSGNKGRGGAGKGGGGGGNNKETEAESKALRRMQEKRFWDKLSKALPDMHFRVWQVLQRYLQKYYKLLAYRSKLVDSAVNLQKQNEELKQLLDQYLGSKVNEELQIPPTHVIRVVAGGAAPGVGGAR